MIGRLKLHNFQIHKGLEINFTPGINVIVGGTDKGKSSIVRALDFALMNGAKKSRVVRNGAKTARVDVEVEGSEIIREKGKSKNSYTVNGMDLAAFGVGVPEEVSSVTRIGDINFQMQHQPPFLVFGSPPAIARYLNKLANLDIIDTTLGFLNSKQLELSKEAGLRQKDFRSGRDAFLTLKGTVETIAADYDDLNREFSEALAVEMDRLALAEILEKYEETDGIEEIGKLVRDFKIVEELYLKAKAFRIQLNGVADLVNAWPIINSPVDLGEGKAIIELHERNVKRSRNLRGVSDLLGQYDENERDFNPADLVAARSEFREKCPVCPLCELPTRRN